LLGENLHPIIREREETKIKGPENHAQKEVGEKTNVNTSRQRAGRGGRQKPKEGVKTTSSLKDKITRKFNCSGLGYQAPPESGGKKNQSGKQLAKVKRAHNPQ